jgi:hypothetical protein
MITMLVISVAVGCLLAELCVRTFGGAWFRNQVSSLGKLLSDFKNTAGDDERQALLLKSGRSTIGFSLGIFAFLLLLAGIASIAPWAFGWGTDDNLIYIISVSVVATLWLIARPKLLSRRRSQINTVKKSSKSTYSELEKVLHRIILAPASVRNLTFEMERAYALPKRGEDVGVNTQSTPKPSDGAVYVCGLARSGTTTLLRILGDIEVFRSLAYRDMPFVLAPNLWKLVTRHSWRPPVSVERAHGDGISVDFDSPESFEEVFWRTFLAQKQGARCLDFAEPSATALMSFADYRSIVANPRGEVRRADEGPLRYLSKNNNNLLRLRSLGDDPTATILLVYRDPISTARSLHRQHLSFCAEQSQDKFVREYMGWLAHHEFGLDHLPFCFAVPLMDKKLHPDKVDYWLEYWNAVYTYVLSQTDSKFVLFNHDKLRAEPVIVLRRLFALLKVNADASLLAQQITASSGAEPDASEFRADIVERSYITYRKLVADLKNLSDADSSSVRST